MNCVWLLNYFNSNKSRFTIQPFFSVSYKIACVENLKPIFINHARFIHRKKVLKNLFSRFSRSDFRFKKLNFQNSTNKPKIQRLYNTYLGCTLGFFQIYHIDSNILKPLISWNYRKITSRLRLEDKLGGVKMYIFLVQRYGCA